MNWKTKKLGELCKATKTVSPRSIFPEKFTYIDISSINSLLRKIVDPKILFVNDAPSRARQLVQSDDILFATTRPYLKNIAFVSSEFNKAVASTGFCVIRPNTKLVIPDFIFLVVNSDEFIDRVVAKQKGATYPAVKDSDIFEIEIPLPPLETQKKIVKMLDEKMGKIGEAKRLRAEALADTEKILPQTLHEIFEEGKKNGWEEKSFDDKEILKMTSGGTPSRANDDFYHGNIPWLKSGELRDSTNIIESEEKISEEAVKNSSAKIFPKGTVLFAMYGATAGKIGILGVDASTNQAVAGMIPVSEKLDNKFLYYFLMKKREEIVSQAWGGAQPNLSQTILKTFFIPIPTLTEQQKIVAKLDALSEKVRTLRDLQTAQLADFKALVQAHLREAFVLEN